MRNKYKIIALLTGVLSSYAVSYASGHDHDHSGHSHEGHGHEEHGEHEELVAPNGGRIVDSVEPHLEFLITPERKVQITFLDDHGHVIAPAAQKITLIGGSRSSPTRLSFSKQGSVLISNGVLPQGNNLPIVLQIKEEPNAKTVMERFMLNMSQCPTCEYKEYACTCEHGGHGDHDDHSGHKH